MDEISTLPNFHGSDDNTISASASPTNATLVSSPRLQSEESIFSQANSLKRKKPLHMYGRKSTSRSKIVDSPSKLYIPPLAAFRELLAESAEERDIESSSPARAKRTKVLDVAPVKETRRERTITEGAKNGKRALLLAVAGSEPLQRQAAAVSIEKDGKQKKPYQFRRPFPLVTAKKGQSRGDVLGERSIVQINQPLLAAEATEIIEDYSEASGLARQGTARSPSDSMILTDIDAVQRSEGPGQGKQAPRERTLSVDEPSDMQTGDDWNFDTGPLQPAIDDAPLELQSNGRPRLANNSMSRSIASLQLPTAAQRAASTSRSSDVSSRRYSGPVPNISVTTATSPPRPTATPSIASSPMAIDAAPLAAIQSVPPSSAEKVSIASFLRLAMPEKLARPPPPPILPFRSLSRPITPARVFQAYVSDSELDEGGLNDAGYLSAGRRGWWVLPLAAPSSMQPTSAGVILGLGNDLPSSIPVGTVIWTLPRLRLLFKQVAAMASTRKWGMLDIFPIVTSSEAMNIHITCPAHLALRLRTVLSEMACKLDEEGDEIDEPAGIELREEQIGKMWLGVEAGVRLVWWDEMERVPVLLA